MNSNQTSRLRLNVGSADRVIRLVLAIGLVIAGVLWGPLGVGPVIMYVVAAVLTVTALARSCPLYALFGIRTCPLRPSRTTP